MRPPKTIDVRRRAGLGQLAMAALATDLGEPATGPLPAKVAVAGAWKDPQNFQMQWRYDETPHFDTVTLHFSERRVEATLLNSLTQMAS